MAGLISGFLGERKRESLVMKERQSQPAAASTAKGRAVGLNTKMEEGSEGENAFRPDRCACSVFSHFPLKSKQKTGAVN